MTDAQKALGGGWGQEDRPVKAGGVIYRQGGKNSTFVHELLLFLADHNYSWSPRYLGQDDQGREIVQYIDGYVPHGQEVPAETWSLETMIEIFRQIRALHDLTAKSPLSGSAECVCHGDLGYANTVYKNGKAIAFIDWDLAHPGQRVDDVAHAIMQYLSLGEYLSPAGPGERAGLARKLADAYGLTAGQRSQLTDSMLTQLQSIHKEQLEAIKSGSRLGKRLADAEVPEIILKRYNWLRDNKIFFDKAFV